MARTSPRANVGPAPQVYDGLVEYGAGGAIVPALATSWNIADNADGPGKEYTFQLRRGVEFHDGAPWNCEVATLNFDHVLAPPLTTGDWHGWYGLPGMIDGWGCGDNEYEFFVTTKESYCERRRAGRHGRGAGAED